MAAELADDFELAATLVGQLPRLILLIGGSLPCEYEAVHDGNAQISGHPPTAWRTGEFDRGCVRTSARFHTSLFRSLLRGLRAFRVEKIAKSLAPLDRLQNFAEFLHGLDPLLPLKIGPTNGREGRQSGLPLMAWGAPGATPEEASCERRSTRSGAPRGCGPADFPYCLHSPYVEIQKNENELRRNRNCKVLR
jgi:hypothetical protein